MISTLTSKAGVYTNSISATRSGVTSTITVTTPQQSVSVSTLGKIGPSGPPGSMVDGTDDGDIIRWNATTESWEAKQEPFEFNGIVLTPQEAAILETEGAVYYSSTDKTIKVCIDEE